MEGLKKTGEQNATTKVLRLQLLEVKKGTHLEVSHLNLGLVHLEYLENSGIDPMLLPSYSPSQLAQSMVKQEVLMQDMLSMILKA